MRDDRKLTGTQVSRWERGQQMPSPDNFHAIERALGARLVGDEMVVGEAHQLVAVVKKLCLHLARSRTVVAPRRAAQARAAHLPDLGPLARRAAAYGTFRPPRS